MGTLSSELRGKKKKNLSQILPPSCFPSLPPPRGLCGAKEPLHHLGTAASSRYHGWAPVTGATTCGNISGFKIKAKCRALGISRFWNAEASLPEPSSHRQSHVSQNKEICLGSWKSHVLPSLIRAQLHWWYCHVFRMILCRSQRRENHVLHYLL